LPSQIALQGGGDANWEVCWKRHWKCQVSREWESLCWILRLLVRLRLRLGLEVGRVDLCQRAEPEADLVQRVEREADLVQQPAAEQVEEAEHPDRDRSAHLQGQKLGSTRLEAELLPLQQRQLRCAYLQKYSKFCCCPTSFCYLQTRMKNPMDRGCLFPTSRY
jgi:hypothetical protein